MRRFLTPVFAAAALMALTAGGAVAQDAQKGQCFDLTRQRSFSALDDHTMLIRVDGGRIFRVDLAGSCPALARPDPTVHLVADGSSFVCGRLDYHLEVGAGAQVASSVPCNVAGQHLMTPAELSAVPRNKLPR
jgi:hypothetical protein